ncbi:MAG: dipeptidase PepE [Lutibacter sp.]
MKSLLIASTSTIHGSSYLSYLLPELKIHFKNCNEVLFIPYAKPGGISYDEYTNLAKEVFLSMGFKLKGIHEFENKFEAVRNASGIFIGGGNTFLLLKTLYEEKLVSVIKHVVINGTPYFGTSAGSNLTGLTINNTNDMPIVYPPSYDAFGFLNFNINPHYLDPNPNSKHMGETRETRIKEFHKVSKIPVLGLREGSWLKVLGDDIVLKGNLDARLFTQNKSPLEIKPETKLNFLV